MALSLPLEGRGDNHYVSVLIKSLTTEYISFRKRRKRGKKTSFNSVMCMYGMQYIFKSI